MPTPAQFASLKQKIATELSELTEFTERPAGNNDLFGIDLKNGTFPFVAHICVIRTDLQIRLDISGGHYIPGNRFRITGIAEPKKYYKHNVMYVGLVNLAADGSHEPVVGSADVVVTPPGPKHPGRRSESYIFEFPTCRRAYDFIAHVARLT